MIKAESNADHTNTEVTISGSLDEVLNAFRGICKSMKTALESRFGKEDGNKIYAAIVGDLSDEEQEEMVGAIIKASAEKRFEKRKNKASSDAVEAFLKAILSGGNEDAD